MSNRDSSTIGDTMEETKDRHMRYHRAVQNPIRRNILRSMQKGNITFESLSDDTGLDSMTLEWHIRMLEDGYCVERYEIDGKIIFKLTKEGEVVDYLDK
jgi:DNA-binding transcriptional ArsR family regulator